MKKPNAKWIVFLGVLCTVFTAVSAWYSITFNDARIVKPMDFSEYTFRIQDLPMIASIIFVILYVFFLFCLLAKEILVKKTSKCDEKVARKLSPRYGLFGFFGFIGFLGFWTYSVDKTIFPFVFFVFFGFFGFYYEGKLSGTLMDERFKENQLRARMTADKIALMIIFLAVLIVGQGRLMGSLEFTLITFVIAVSLSLALEMFLSQYLLYRFDQVDEIEESEE